MPDVYTTIYEVHSALQERLSDLLELRAADPEPRAMRQEYLSEMEFPRGACALEVGCGTGAVTRMLASWPGVAEVVAIDHSPTFLARARELGAGMPNLSFREILWEMSHSFLVTYKMRYF